MNLDPNIRSAKLKSLSTDEQGCVLVPEFEVESGKGATFDYDLRTKSEVDATRKVILSDKSYRQRDLPIVHGPIWHPQNILRLF